VDIQKKINFVDIHILFNFILKEVLLHDEEDFFKLCKISQKKVPPYVALIYEIFWGKFF
jgi:hypothetical protein